ncbi:spore germination protein GerPC [Bacillus mycoides]|jgi:spore germination protein PC|uniref:Spore gernimation protein GerPC n=1 Tax=Bacillus thuringiensis serovar navarrensis TaxID=339658 RepID=A0A243ANW6_BACTU|nr:MULTISPECIES: spore germination protein GerPC [Bacillus]EEK74453.1 spore germination protein gerPC [Bacillus mycoides]MBE7150541.1 spore germination protein GerPC [Bacillus mycoides]MBK5425903.1 spore germination protein GerPC [Bacillus sp. TH30]MDM5426593.1 spore germination protein GerPC [Bacillus mycoides]MED1267948.1 spore germination protein GerPC [Bacillus mycoides]
MNQDIYTYLHQLQQALQIQQQTILNLEEQVRLLQEELNELKSRPSSSIGKVEYKFDQLKVENLNGTLNIGLNPFSTKGQQIEDFQVDTETLKVNPETETNPDFYQGILQEMHRYLDEEAYSRILHFEQEERTPLDEMYRQMMVDDIKKQMEHRLPYYLSQVQSYEGISTDPDYLRDVIIQAMKQDIDKAFLSFIQHIPGNFRKE